MPRIKHVAVIPTLLTLGNLLSGIAAIQRALSGIGTTGEIDLERVVQAAMLCLVAMVFDILDGSVARFTHTSSRFGAELDSLADLTSFGVAPSIIVIVLLRSFGGMDRYAGVCLAAYAAFGALRLARYNVEDVAGEKPMFPRKAPPPMHFSGLPIPGACGTVVSTIILVEYVAREGGWIGRHWPWFLQIAIMVMPFFMLGVGFLMVSRIPYPHLAKMFLSGKRPFTYFLTTLIAITLVFLHPELTLFAGFQAYVGYGLLRAALLYILRRQKTPEEAPNAPTQQQ